MLSETEGVLKELSHVKNIQNEEGEVIRPAKRILRHGERVSREKELDQLNEKLSQPSWVLGQMTAEGKKAAIRRQRQLRRELAEWSPPEVSGQVKDELVRYKDALEEKFRNGMQSNEEMRRNPSGAVGRFMEWEKKNKPDVLTWKNLMATLHPDSDDPELCSIERVRPSMFQPEGAATFMADAQIPGHFAMSPLAKENWPLGEPKVDTPLKQADRVEQLEKEKADLEARLSALEAEKERKEKIKKKRQENMAVLRARKKRYEAMRQQSPANPEG